MVRTVYATEEITNYISSIEKSNDIQIGLLFGQPCTGKDYIVHVCLTPPYKDSQKNDQKKAKSTSINDINENWVAEHARHATRMLPGGIYVLGIFIISEENLLSPFNPKIKSILLKIHQNLNGLKHLYGNFDTDRIILNYSTKLNQFYCKSFEVGTSYVQPADFKILNTQLKWQSLECKYDVDFLYHIRKHQTQIELKTHIKYILDEIKQNLRSAIILYNGEAREYDECLENILKKKVQRKVGNHKEQQEDLRPIQVLIYELYNGLSPNCKLECYDSVGQIQITGQIASKVWMNPKENILKTTDAIIEDIMRSLVTRIDMHWDSLTEEEHSEEVNTIHEPPRRVFIPLSNNQITVSDYLFPGESLPELMGSLQDLLGMKNVQLEDVQDIEGQADLAHYTDVLDSSNKVDLPKPADTNKLIYFVGLGVALLVLILSLLIHFIKQ